MLESPAQPQAAPPDETVHCSLPLCDPEVLAIVEDFPARLDAMIDHIRRALDAAAESGLAHLAHALKGTGGTIGFEPLTDLARRMENTSATTTSPPSAPTSTASGVHRTVTEAQAASRRPA